MNCYTVIKQTANHADVLAAVGAADVLRHLDPRIVDCGDRFEVRIAKDLKPSDLDAVDAGFSYLVRPKQAAPNLPPERIVPCVTVAENRMYSILGRMKAFGGPNRVISRFAKMKREQWERRVWECLHGQSEFVPASPLVQLFNPHAARGYALLKPSGTQRNDKTKDRWAEPFTEWLRFRGYFEGSAGWFASGDLRLYCPIPSDVPYAQFAGFAAEFRELRLGGTAVKMDCRALLGLTRLLIDRAETYRRPRTMIGGVWVTHYKDMGQAHTLMGMEQLAVPDWFELRTAQHAEAWLRTIEEHDVILRRLNDSHSDEFALLKQYRRTFQICSQGSIAEFQEFLMGYAMLLYKRRAQDRWELPQVHTSRDRVHTQTRCRAANRHAEPRRAGGRGGNAEFHLRSARGAAQRKDRSSRSPLWAAVRSSAGRRRRQTLSSGGGFLVCDRIQSGSRRAACGRSSRQADPKP